MPTYTQYRSTTGGYSSPTSAIVQTALNDAVPIRDDYLAFQSGQNTTVVLIGQNDGGNTFTDVEVVVIDRSNSSSYTVSRLEYSEVTFSVSNEYYTYSSIGMGQFMNFPRTDYYMCWAVIVSCIFCVMATVLRNLFPRWGKR